MGRHELQTPPGMSREEVDSLRPHMQDIASSVPSSEPLKYRNSGPDYIPVPTDPLAQAMEMFDRIATLGNLAALRIGGVGVRVDRSISPQN